MSGAPKWIKLASPQVSLNAPNVTPITMKYTKTVPWDMNADKMFEPDMVARDAKHLIFNCHGFPTGKKADFPPAHLSIGTVLFGGNVDAFSAIGSITSLRVIWIASCNIADGSGGDEFCKAMAKKSACYVVCQFLAVPDRRNRTGHVEDYDYAMPKYWDSDGELISRSTFLSYGNSLGFVKV
jgi:hypothetical protein